MTQIDFFVLLAESFVLRQNHAKDTKAFTSLCLSIQIQIRKPQFQHTTSILSNPPKNEFRKSTNEAKMSTTVHVQGISHETTEKEVKVSTFIT